MKAIVLILMAFMLAGMKCNGTERGPSDYNAQSYKGDTIAVKQLKSALDDKKFMRELHFPNSTLRLYRARNYNYSWFYSADKMKNLWDAMMLLDCVKQYGLNREQYHPQQLSYDVLEKADPNSSADNERLRVRTDILLTDAIIRFIAHLHFGVENPVYSQKDIDNDKFTGLKIDSVLRNALHSGFEKNVLAVQPRSQAYSDLQEYMKITVGQQAGDCYQTPEESFKLMAVNLERLRWHDSADRLRIEVNIASQSLNLINGEQRTVFKIRPGSPSHQTPAFAGKISYFTTAPEWAVPDSIFRSQILPKIIKNPEFLLTSNYSIYNKKGKYIIPTIPNLEKVSLNPEKYRMCQSEGRANPLGQVLIGLQDQQPFLYGSLENTPALDQYAGRIPMAIRIEQPAPFLKGLLTANGVENHVFATASEAMASYQKYTYTFIDPVTIVVRYLTCEVRDGELVSYPDTYKLDMPMIERLFGSVKFKTWTN